MNEYIRLSFIEMSFVFFLLSPICVRIIPSKSIYVFLLHYQCLMVAIHVEFNTTHTYIQTKKKASKWNAPFILCMQAHSYNSVFLYCLSFFTEPKSSDTVWGCCSLLMLFMRNNANTYIHAREIQKKNFRKEHVFIDCCANCWCLPNIECENCLMQ